MIDQNQATAIWLYFNLSHAHHLPSLIEEHGFKIHHSKYINEKPEFVVTKWLKSDREDPIPHFSSHCLGVGGVVIHPDQKRMLMIKEKYGNNPKWKIPGGLVDIGETLEKAAIREVYEETGI